MADLRNSETVKNLMRAFAGESQARNRYTFAASAAKKEGLPVIEAVFQFTAGQEKEHAEVYYNYLKELTGDTMHNEYEEYDPVYRTFGDIAKEEGFSQIASTFYMIAEIEKTHGDRFNLFADLMEQNKLFVSDVSTGWMCLNCGYVYQGTSAPAKCPVCRHEQGYFIRLELAPYAK